MRLFKNVLVQDIIFFLIWLCSYAFQVASVYMGIRLTMIDATHTGFQAALLWLMIVFVIGGLQWATNSWPALFWRYRQTVESRIIHVQRERSRSGNVYEYYYLQVKLFGSWINITFEGRRSCIMARSRDFAPSVLWLHQSQIDEEQRNLQVYLDEGKKAFPLISANDHEIISTKTYNKNN